MASSEQENEWRAEFERLGEFINKFAAMPRRFPPTVKVWKPK
jgi:hypothetical protein